MTSCEVIMLKPLKIEGLISEELEGLNEIIYVNPESGSSFSLNLTAAAILDLCNGQRSHDDLAGVLHDTLHVGRQQAGADVEAILAEFAENGLIHADDTPDEKG